MSEGRLAIPAGGEEVDACPWDVDRAVMREVMRRFENFPFMNNKEDLEGELVECRRLAEWAAGLGTTAAGRSYRKWIAHFASDIREKIARVEVEARVKAAADLIPKMPGRLA